MRGFNSFEDRRKSPRVLLDLPVEYWNQYNPDACRGGIAIDASEIGFLIHSIEDMLINTQLRIIVLYPWEYGLANLEVYAEVVRKDIGTRRWRYLYGLKFIAISGEDHCKLSGLLRDNLEPPLPTPIKPTIEKKRFKWF
jgi:hypothetical protein